MDRLTRHGAFVLIELWNTMKSNIVMTDINVDIDIDCVTEFIYNGQYQQSYRDHG
jgi:hypothetical protein